MQEINYLVPSSYFPEPRLDDLLILLPSYSGPTLRTRAFIDHMVQLGATVCSSFGVSDVALHRCLVAGQALEAFQSGKCHANFVLWLDDDMVGTPSHVAFLRAAARELGAVTGVYCKRNNPSQVTIRRQAGETSKKACVVSETTILEAVEWTSHPVLCGMGCLMLTSEVFLQHVRAMPTFWGGPKRAAIPAVCASGICPDEQGRNGWVSEDQCYCQGLWQYCSGVWTAPIAFAHVSEVSLIPNRDARWLENHESDEPIDPDVPTVAVAARSVESPRTTRDSFVPAEVLGSVTRD